MSTSTDMNDIDRLKTLAGTLFNNNNKHENLTFKKNEPTETDHYDNQLFTKETFVISDADLEMINEDVKNQLVIDEFKELNHNDVYPKNYYENDYYNDYEEVYNEKDTRNDYENVEDELDQDDDTYFTELDKLSYKQFNNDNDNDNDYDLNNDINEPENESDHANTKKDVDSDTDFDNTHFLYDPPFKYKEKFLVYLLKSSPLLIIVLVLFIISSIVSEDSILGIKNLFSSSFSQQSENSKITPFLTHKVYLLEEEMKSLRKLQKLNDKVTNIETEFFDLKNHITKLEINFSNNKINSNNDVDDNILINPLFEKITRLESKVESLSKDLKDEKLDNHIIKNNLLNENNDKKNNKHDTKIIHKLKSKYFNIAGQCNVIRQLTTYPPLSQYKREKRRKTIKSRIIHGFPDFIKRITNLSKTKQPPIVNTLGKIKLFSSANSPKNVLSEQPSLFWQNIASEMPIYFTVGIKEPIIIHELGIYHSRQQPNFKYIDDLNNKELQKRWYNSAPKNIEFLVKPILTEQKDMKNSISNIYNQDLKFNLNFKKKINPEYLNGWIRIGEIKYDINSNRSYQPLIWSNEMKIEMQKWHINEFMVIIHSNWGDEIVVLDTLRIFQQQEGMENGVENDQIGIVRYVDGHEGINHDDEVLFLGEDNQINV